MASNKRILSPEGVLSFPSLFEAKLNPNNPAAPAKFETMIVFPVGTDLSELEALVEEAIVAKFGDDRPANLRNPIRDGSEKADKLGGPFVAGAKFITVKSQFQPGIVDRNTVAVIDPSEIYPGVGARVQLHAFAYDASGNKGVGFGLDNVQKIRDNAPLDGRADAASQFTVVEVDDLL